MKQSKKYIIALTGNIGSGKSTVRKLIAEDFGFFTLSADDVTELSYQNASESLKNEFGEKIFDNGVVNRAALSSIVFTDKEKLSALSRILQPFIMKNLFDSASKTEGITFIEIPLLFESKLENFVDEIWLVTAKKQIQLERLMKRNNLSRENAEKRLYSQIPDEIKINKSHIIIYNNDGFVQLKKIVAVEIEKLKERYAK